MRSPGFFTLGLGGWHDFGLQQRLNDVKYIFETLEVQVLRLVGEFVGMHDAGDTPLPVEFVAEHPHNGCKLPHHLRSVGGAGVCAAH